MEETETKPADELAATSVEETAAVPSQADDPDSPTTDEAADAAAIERDDLLAETDAATPEESAEARQLAILEAIVYVTDEPLSVQQIAGALGQPIELIRSQLDKLVAEYSKPEHGLMIREVAGGYKMATKPEHHEAVRTFAKNLNPPLKLSLAALETLAVIAYKQPITAPEIMEIRGVQGAGVLKTLLDRKLITTSGRKNVVGRPILYRTTKDFLVQFGLKDLTELPTLKEFEELRRLALGSDEPSFGVVGDRLAETAADPEQPMPPPPDPAPDQPAPDTPEPESPGTAPDEPESPGGTRDPDA